MSRLAPLARAVYRGWTALWATRGRVLSPNTAIAGSHSHNDYQQWRPLRTALRHGLVSVEADIWPVDGDLLVGHDKSDLRGGRTLRSMYLAPLANAMAADGKALPDWERPLQLLVDIKSDPPLAFQLLKEQLREFRQENPTGLTHYVNGAMAPGSISVVVTGDYPPDALVEHHNRLVAFDGRLSTDYTEVPAEIMPLCSDHWHNHFQWKGLGAMPAAEQERLTQLVKRAHAAGRQVRFWGVPIWPARARRAVWRELALAGVDYIGVDHPADFRRWRRSHGF